MCGWNRAQLCYVTIFASCVVVEQIVMIILLVPASREVVLSQLMDAHAEFWETRAFLLAIYYAAMAAVQLAWVVPLMSILVHRRVMFKRGRYDIYHTV